MAIPSEVGGRLSWSGGNGPEPRRAFTDEAKAPFPGAAAADRGCGAVSLFALSHANSGNSYLQVTSSKIISLINQGQVTCALISDTNQTIHITTKSGKQLKASWDSSQGSQLRNALQAQLDKGNLPGGYNVTISKSNALPDIVASALIMLVIILLLFWGVDHSTQFKRGGDTVT